MAGVGGFELVMELVNVLGWPLKFAIGAKEQYMLWIELKIVAKDFRNSRLEPSPTVALVWDVHRQWSLDYMAMCEDLGGYIHHFPLADRDNASRETAYNRTLEAYKTLFGKDPPSLYWEPFGAPSNGSFVSAAAAVDHLASPGQGFHEPNCEATHSRRSLCGSGEDYPDAAARYHDNCMSNRRDADKELAANPQLAALPDHHQSGKSKRLVISTDGGELGYNAQSSQRLSTVGTSRKRSREQQEESLNAAPGMHQSSPAHDFLAQRSSDFPPLHGSLLPASLDELSDGGDSEGCIPPSLNLAQTSDEDVSSDSRAPAAELAVGTARVPPEMTQSVEVQHVTGSHRDAHHSIRRQSLENATLLNDSGRHAMSGENKFGRGRAERGRLKDNQTQDIRVSSEQEYRPDPHHSSDDIVGVHVSEDAPRSAKSHGIGSQRASQSASSPQESRVTSHMRPEDRKGTLVKSIEKQNSGVLKKFSARMAVRISSLSERRNRSEGLVLRPLLKGQKRGRGRPRLSDYVQADEIDCALVEGEPENSVGARGDPAPVGIAGSPSAVGGQVNKSMSPGLDIRSIINSSGENSLPQPIKRGRGRPRKDGRMPIAKSSLEKLLGKDPSSIKESIPSNSHVSIAQLSSSKVDVGNTLGADLVDVNGQPTQVSNGMGIEVANGVVRDVRQGVVSSGTAAPSQGLLKRGRGRPKGSKNKPKV